MRVLLVLVLLLVASGCGDPEVALERTDGPGGTWVLVEGAPLVEGYPVTLRVEDGQIGGTAACNSYGGEVAISGDGFSVGDVMRTEMGCPEPGVHASESAYLDALAGVDRWERSGDQLVLSGGEDVRLVFDVVPPEEDVPLVGTRWELASLISGTGPDGVASSTTGDAWMQLADDGSWSGADGCNQQDGTWEQDGDRLRIAVTSTTDAGCPEGVQPQADHVADVLTGQPSAEVAGPGLTLTAGELGLSYRAAD